MINDGRNYMGTLESSDMLCVRSLESMERSKKNYINSHIRNILDAVWEDYWNYFLCNPDDNLIPHVMF